MATSATDPAINTNHMLQEYYSSLESRIGYRFILGGTRHFGYYKTDKSWPFPISEALRAMENHLYNTLGVKTGEQVLDAGCGNGYVAIHMAKRGLSVQAIDVIGRHIGKAGGT
jgi:sterol 24-C-methyltransferase